jgi:menaquinone-specific isochorismate synthase
VTVLPLDPAKNASPEALRDFFAQCQAAARRDGQGKLVSISLTVEALDPLAVLESIFEAGEPHFYAERPDIGSALAGAETATAFVASGPGRFAAVQQWIDATLAHTIAVGEVTAPFGGPHFFTGFTFHDEVEAGESFPAARVFVPRWQVARAGKVTTAVANVLVEPTVELEPLVARVWRAHAKFKGFHYGATGATEPAPTPAFTVTEAGDYRKTVEAALRRIAADEFSKIVLARALDVTASQPLHPLRVLNGLRQRFPDCYAFSFANGRGQSFIGASPERLVRVSKGILETEALAGSIRRGDSGQRGRGTAPQALLHSEKDLREHQARGGGHRGPASRRPGTEAGVFAAQPRVCCRPGERAAPAHTDPRARCRRACSLLDLRLPRLHPTPAVGGTPQSAAAVAAHRANWRAFSRGLYAGTVRLG